MTRTQESIVSIAGWLVLLLAISAAVSALVIRLTRQEEPTDVATPGGKFYATTFEHDGHRFIGFTSHRTNGIHVLHHPDCECQK